MILFARSHWPYRLMVRTLPSHGKNRGSNPRRVTNHFTYLSSVRHSVRTVSLFFYLYNHYVKLRIGMTYHDATIEVLRIKIGEKKCLRKLSRIDFWGHQRCLQ